MSTLSIKDLTVTADLDADTMATVRGGTYQGWHPQWSPTGLGAVKTTIGAEQLIGQSQDVLNNNGNNVAFASCISSTVKPTQTGNNSISF